jgi:hypothetical protein
MNTANLQLEGFYLVIAALNQALVAKGVMSREEIGHALRVAESLATGDDRATEDLSPANRDAVAFPARLLILANQIGPEEPLPGFSELARQVGTTKLPYNDQR